jgi:hypothetical protein
MVLLLLQLLPVQVASAAAVAMAAAAAAIASALDTSELLVAEVAAEAVVVSAVAVVLALLQALQQLPLPLSPPRLLKVPLARWRHQHCRHRRRPRCRPRARQRCRRPFWIWVCPMTSATIVWEARAATSLTLQRLPLRLLGSRPAGPTLTSCRLRCGLPLCRRCTRRLYSAVKPLPRSLGRRAGTYPPSVVVAAVKLASAPRRVGGRATLAIEATPRRHATHKQR